MAFEQRNKESWMKNLLWLITKLGLGHFML